MSDMILIVTHKEADIPVKDGYRIITVGPNKPSYMGAFSDDSGENIAEKNAYYCELTALYWFWKNNTEKYINVGMVHYRRFFSKKVFGHRDGDIINCFEIEKIMKKYGVILAEEFHFPCSVEEYYYKHGAGRKEDFDKLREIIKQNEPDYVNTFEIVAKRNHASYCNMFIMKLKDFEAYCEWLFKILHELENMTVLDDYSPAEARIYGYLSEILLNVWVEKRKLRIKRLPIYEREINKKEYFKYKLKKKLSFIRNDIAFLLKRY